MLFLGILKLANLSAFDHIGNQLPASGTSEGMKVYPGNVWTAPGSQVVSLREHRVSFRLYMDLNLSSMTCLNYMWKTIGRPFSMS